MSKLDKEILSGTIDLVNLAKATLVCFGLVRLQLSIKFFGPIILEKFYIRHMTTLRISHVTRYSLGAYSKNTYLGSPKLSLNLT